MNLELAPRAAPVGQVEAIGGDHEARLRNAVKSLPPKATSPASKPTVQEADLQLLVRSSQREARGEDQDDNPNAALRDLAALVFLSLGLRGIEVCRLRWED